MDRYLVTGGAGFIGSHVVDLLVSRGHQVIVMDSLIDQVHQNGEPPSYLNKKAIFMHADVRDEYASEHALLNCDVLIHLAGAVGVGQSQYEVRHYTDVNATGTANLLDIIVNKRLPVKKIVVAASMSSYGEGLYHCMRCGLVRPGTRSNEQMAAKDWELHCPKCNEYVNNMPIRESDIQYANSVYALNKKWQEELVLSVGNTYGIPSVALRFFNVFGPRQSLSNPYNGVAAIFISRLKNNQRPIVYEDGNQTRDFISVHDVAEAIYTSASTSRVDGLSVNVGSGKPVGIAEIGRILARLMQKDIEPEVTQSFRKGDTRHCYADNTVLMNQLGLEKLRNFDECLNELIEWSSKETATDNYGKAQDKLKEHNLA